MSWINLSALWKIIVFGLIAGAGLPSLFAIGLYSLSKGPRVQTAGGGDSGTAKDAAADVALERRIIEIARENLADFKVPRAVYYVDDFPRATLDKVAKNQLRELANGFPEPF